MGLGGAGRGRARGLGTAGFERLTQSLSPTRSRLGLTNRLDTTTRLVVRAHREPPGTRCGSGGTAGGESARSCCGSGSAAITTPAAQAEPRAGQQTHTPHEPLPGTGAENSATGAADQRRSPRSGPSAHPHAPAPHAQAPEPAPSPPPHRLHSRRSSLSEGITGPTPQRLHVVRGSATVQQRHRRDHTTVGTTLVDLRETPRRISDATQSLGDRRVTVTRERRRSSRHLRHPPSRPNDHPA